MGTGVTENTWQNLILDTGVVYVNYGGANERILGATNGGVSFGWQAFNTRQPEIDGLLGPIKGATRIIEAVPQISVNLVEWSLENLQMGFPGYTATQSGTGLERVTVLTRNTRLIPEADYLDNVAVVGTLSSGEDVVALVKNALVIGGISIPMNPDSESTVEMIFVGHYDSATPNDEPWEIRYPDPDTSGT